MENIDTQKVVELFESSYTEQLYDRKASFIIRLCEERSDGFFFNEMENLIKIVKFVLDDYADGQVPLPT
jgi:hypothetical protein